MTQIEDIVIKLLRASLTGKSENIPHGVDWMKVIDLAQSQGVLGICFDAIEHMPESSRPDMECLMEWLGQVSFLEDKNRHNWKTACELADRWKNNGIKTVVLKGFSLCQYYSNPDHRFSGDMDVVLLDGRNLTNVVFNKGNDVIERMGVTVDRGQYKHSKFEYDGLSVENHQFCVSVRGDKRAKKMEAFLEGLLASEELSPINDSDMLCPSPMFNALFVTAHNQAHFLHEKVCLRHLCDWIVLKKACKEQIDWEEYKDKTITFGLAKFSKSMEALADYIIGVKDFESLDACEIRLLEDVFTSEVEGVFDVSLSSRFRAIKNIWCSRWKYELFTDEGAIRHFLTIIKGFLFDRNPVLNV